MAKKSEILADLHAWGYDSEMYVSLDWPDLQSFHATAKDSREAAAAAEQSDANEDAATAQPEPVINTEAASAAPEPVVNAEAASAASVPVANAEAASAASVPVVNAETASAAPEPAINDDPDDSQDDDLDDLLVKVKAKIGFSFDCKDVVLTAEADYKTGDSVRIKERQRFAVGPETFIYLRQHRLIDELEK